MRPFARETHLKILKCDLPQENQYKLAQVIIEKIAKNEICFNYFSLIQSLTTLHRDD
jgi:hypothetical protein